MNFGVYMQDVDRPDEKEKIEWLVLDIKDGKALVISKYVLDCEQYNMDKEDITWERCTLRKWLNNDFINAAFSSQEAAMILTTTAAADMNPTYYTAQGNATQDKIFLLSIAEANRYFVSDTSRECKATEYAIEKGAYVNNLGNSWWWLRTIGGNRNDATYVYGDGTINEFGHFVNTGSTAIRPAMWIDINA